MPIQVLERAVRVVRRYPEKLEGSDIIHYSTASFGERVELMTHHERVRF